MNYWKVLEKNFLVPLGIFLFIIVVFLYTCEYFNVLRVSEFLPLKNISNVTLILFAYSLFRIFYKYIKASENKSVLNVLKYILIINLFLIFGLKMSLLLYPDTDISGIHYSVIKYVSIILVFVGTLLGSLLVSLTRPMEIKETVIETNNKKRNYIILLVIIGSVFIVSKLVLPFVLTGSYADEYGHLNSAIEILKSGHPIESSDYASGYYTRGYYVSALVALIFVIFGKSILIAKLIPATMGIINFLILYAVSKMVFTHKTYRLLLLLIYSLSPLIIFNDFYIRMYVFYEFFTLVNIYLILKILPLKKTKEILIYTASIITLNLVNIIFSKDQGSFLVAIIPLLFFIIRYFQVSKELGVLYLKDIFTKFKLIFSSIALIIFILVFHIPGKILDFLTGTFPGTTPPQLKYDNLFFNENAILTIFLLVSIFTLSQIKSEGKKLIIILTVIMLALHFVSSPDIQLSRTILYLMPLFYLSAVVGIESVSKVINKKLLFSILLLITVFNPLILSFLKLPELREEVYYVDYKDTADFVINNCQDKTLYVLHPTYNQNYYQFYDINIDYIPYINHALLLGDKNFINRDNEYWSIIGRTEVAENSLYLYDNNYKCIIVPARFRFASRSISESDFNNLDTLFHKKNFGSMNIYYK